MFVTSERRYETPSDQKTGKIISRFEVLQHKVTRHIDANVRNVKHGQNYVEFGAAKLEIFCKTINLRITNVRSAPRSSVFQFNVGLLVLRRYRSMKARSHRPNRIGMMCRSNLRFRRLSSAGSMSCLPVNVVSSCLKCASSQVLW